MQQASAGDAGSCSKLSPGKQGFLVYVRVPLSRSTEIVWGCMEVHKGAFKIPVVRFMGSLGGCIRCKKGVCGF